MSAFSHGKDRRYALLVMQNAKKVEPLGTVHAKRSGLSKGIVKQALQNLDWKPLKKHLDELCLSEGSLEALLGQVRRTNSLILKYSNRGREKSRKKFFSALEKYVRLKVSPAAATFVLQELDLLECVETAYRGILGLLEKCSISESPAELRIAASIARAGHQYVHLMAQLQQTLSGLKSVLYCRAVLSSLVGKRSPSGLTEQSLRSLEP